MTSSSFRLEPGQAVFLSDTRYVFEERERGRKKFRNADTGAVHWVEELDLDRAFSSGELRFAAHESVPRSRAELQTQHLSDLPERTRASARKRESYVRAHLANIELGYPDSSEKVIDDVFERRRQAAFDAGEAFKEKKPGLSTVYEWRQAWEAPGKPNTMRLVFAESQRGTRGSRKLPDVDRIMTDATRALFLTPRRRLVKTVHDRVVAICTRQGMLAKDIPCQQTIRRAIGDLSPRLVMEARRGKRAADLMFKGLHKMRVPEFAGEVLEVDAHKLNLIGVDESGIVLGRLWVTVAIDRCTRMIMGFHVHVGPPSSLTIAACLRHAFGKKDYVAGKYPTIGRDWPAWGVPVVVVLDNAFENKAHFLIEAAEEIGFAIQWAAPRTPEDKPFIERWFGTLESDLIRNLPGNTGLNPQDLGDYDAARMAFVSEADLDYLIHQYVMTVYNCGHHRGINDVPERLWKERTAETEVTPYTNPNALDVLLGHVAWRVPSRRGIELLGLLYNGRGNYDIIEHIRSRAGAADVTRLRVRFDPTDLDVIFVQDPLTGKYEPVQSEDPEYTRGLTLARHRAIRARAVERKTGYISVRDLCLARDRLQEQIDLILGSRQETGRRAAHLLNDGRARQSEELRLLLETTDDQEDLSDLLERELTGDEEPEPRRRRARDHKAATELPEAQADRAAAVEVDAAEASATIDGDGEIVADPFARRASAAPRADTSFARRMAELGLSEETIDD